MSKSDLIVLTGPSASGKESVAFELARLLAAEIISLDSMKVYREMDIGTAKPSAEHRRAVRYHLIDLVPPDEHFSTGDYLQRLEEVLDDLRGRGCTGILCGGTALYLKGFLEGFSRLPAADWAVRDRLIEEARQVGTEVLHERLRTVDPEAASRLLPGDLRRIVRALEVFEATGRRVSEVWDWTGKLQRSVRLYGLGWSREELYERVNRRVLDMVERGLLDEARRLGERRPPLSRSASQCIGYKEVFEGLEAGWSEREIVERIQRRTRRFVKHQLTWFRKWPVEWLSCGGDLAPALVARDLLHRGGKSD